MTQPNALLTEIESYLSHSGEAASTFGFKAVNDGKFVARLRGGARAWPETIQRVRDYIASQPRDTTRRTHRSPAPTQEGG